MTEGSYGAIKFCENAGQSSFRSAEAVELDADVLKQEIEKTVSGYQ